MDSEAKSYYPLICIDWIYRISRTKFLTFDRKAKLTYIKSNRFYRTLKYFQSHSASYVYACRFQIDGEGVNPPPQPSKPTFLVKIYQDYQDPSRLPTVGNPGWPSAEEKSKCLKIPPHVLQVMIKLPLTTVFLYRVQSTGTRTWERNAWVAFISTVHFHASAFGRCR